MKYVVLTMALAAGLFAQDKPTVDPAALRETRHHFDLAATRASAYIHSVDSIEANLQQDGAVLHPRIAVLRLRIEAALNEAGAAINERDLKAAENAIERAEALIDRLAREIGG